jgi:hypothetical protein
VAAATAEHCRGGGHKLLSSLLLVACAAHATWIQAAAEAEQAEFSKAHDMEVDGRLAERAWRDATPVTRFFETYPRNVAEPQVRTEARFLFDDRYIYVGVIAYDPDPAGIRSGFVKRDSIDTGQDYIEVLLDPLNRKRTAYSFATNPNGVRRDGQFSDESFLLDTRPDFDFDVQASIDQNGWQAEFRIPLATLRYAVGQDQSWGFIIRRNRPRIVNTTLESIPEPRKATCCICFAGELRGISLQSTAPPLFVTPQITYARGDDVRASLEAKWVARPDTVVDLTVMPDFSQVEADDLQLDANAQFALAVKEKRPFFLEGADIFSTPFEAIYTRSFAQPQAGLRITHRDSGTDYSVMALRDQQQVLIESGALASNAIVLPVDSNAVIGRYTRQVGDVVWGALATARVNAHDMGGSNYVYGFDGTWSPTDSDRVTAQFLLSNTINPNEPDVLPSWDGRHLSGTAHSLAWQHSSDAWSGTLSTATLSGTFRAWNGFVPQAGVSSLSATGGWNLYPRHSLVLRMTPGLSYSSVRELGHDEITSTMGPFLTLELPFSTELTLGWTPKARDTTPQRLSATYDYWSLSLTTTPAAWMPGLSVLTSFGEGIDFRTGDINDATRFTATLPLHLLDRLELITDVGYESQRARLNGRRAFTQRNVQFNLLWHFSSKVYAQMLHQESRLVDGIAEADAGTASSVRGQTFSALLSYQANWQTRYFIGVRHSSGVDALQGDSDTEIFAKFSYVLARQ